MNYINPEPADDARLFRVRTDPATGTREYVPVSFPAVVERVNYALDTQNMSGVQWLLARTVEPDPDTGEGARYYPLPLLLSLSVPLPSYAEQASRRLSEALEVFFRD